jgi:endonuclease YncB( thermonuclease family)|tara:strand:+ start:1847 stop:2038 length:192 start_codon:yes stop_codon:yes gene_type:complete
MTKRLPKVHLTRSGAPKIRNPNVDATERHVEAILKQSMKEGKKSSGSLASLFHDGGSVKAKVY